MNVNDCRDLLNIYNAYHELKSKFDDEISSIADNLKKQISIVYYELFAGDTDSKYRWLYTDTFTYVTDGIVIDDVGIYIQFIEKGRWGNSDEILHYIRFEERMCSDEGIAEIVEEHKQEILKYKLHRDSKIKYSRQAQINILEEKLKKLKERV